MNKSTNDLLIHDKLIIRKYKRYLTPLGVKVMTSLMTIKHERSTKHIKGNLNSTPNPCCQDKRSNSIDFDSLGTLPLVDVSNAENSSTTLKSNSPCHNDYTCVSSSIDLLKAACADDTGIISENVKDTTVPHSGNSSTYSNEAPHYFNTSSSKINEQPDGVSWNNMFDTEILQYLKQNDEDMTNDKKDITSHKKSFNVKSVLQTMNSGSKPNEKNMRNTSVNNLTVKNKRKHTSENVNAYEKKINTIISKKSNENKYFVKEKYTTTVKNWLNDINMTNYCGEEFASGREDEENDNINKASNIEEKISRNTTAPKIKRNRKTVQAQLANKGGIMKYKKPVDALSLENNTNGCKDNVNTSESFNPNDKAVKEKKIEKFVAPIKSQLPVKDITFNVVAINDINFNMIEKMEADTGTMVLMYSNGFCQLNSQHNDETCVPDSILFCFNDTFYYIKNNVDGIKDFLSRILSSTRLICFDAKSVLVYLMGRYELELGSVNIFDTKIGASLISPDEPPDNFLSMQELLAFNAEYTIATTCTLQKAAWYTTLLQDCSEKLSRSLTELDLWRVFDIEMRILPILAAMEYRGISVDEVKLKWMESTLLSRMTAVEAQCHRAAGRVFQVTSAAQVRAVLYDELKLDTKGNVKIQETICKGEKSTAEAMLRSLAHPLPRLVLEHRRLHKAHATFLAGIVQHVRGGVVRPTWFNYMDQSAAATGRIASSNPNLQAIPKNTFELMMVPKDDDPAAAPVGFQLRSLYAARGGHALLAADFKHVECRVLALAADDRRLRAALASADLFAQLAAEWLHKPAAAVSPTDRERTKRMVYASVYGAGARRLAAILDLPYDRALAVIASFNRTFPSLKAFERSVVSECVRSGGRLRTGSGRARTLADVGSTDPAERARAERQAVNFIIQGTAADLCKIAMARTAERLRRAAVRAHPLLQIHDELVWEVPHPHLHAAAVIIKEAMESSGQECGMAVSLPVAMYCGPTWGDMQPYHPHPHPHPHPHHTEHNTVT